MVILRRKQIILMTLCVFISVFTFMFTTAKEETNETVVLPISRKNYNLRCGTWNSR